MCKYHDCACARVRAPCAYRSPSRSLSSTGLLDLGQKDHLPAEHAAPAAQAPPAAATGAAAARAVWPSSPHTQTQEQVTAAAGLQGQEAVLSLCCRVNDGMRAPLLCNVCSSSRGGSPSRSNNQRALAWARLVLDWPRLGQLVLSWPAPEVAWFWLAWAGLSLGWSEPGLPSS